MKEWHQSQRGGEYRDCLACGKNFYLPPSAIKRGRGKFCSWLCANRTNNKNRHDSVGIKIVCETCKKMVTVKPSRYKRSKTRFCSQDCYTHKLSKTCEICNKIYKVQRWNTHSRFCSSECLGKFNQKNLSGAGSHTWKGGVTPQRVIDRNTPEVRAWKKLVFRRDNYTCVLCGKYGGYLIADHYPYPFYRYISKRTDPNNGRTLCYDCNYVKTYKEKEWSCA